MIQIIKYATIATILFLLSTINIFAASITNPSYYNSTASIPANESDPCPVPCAMTDSGQPLTQQCWNGATPGVKTSCGDACLTGGGDAQMSWTWYIFNQAQCRYDSVLSQQFAETVCVPIYTVSGATCSTADKYNSNPDFPGGDLTEARYGSCDCSAGSIYKTCCSNGTPFNTYNYTVATGQGNPLHPDAGCAGTSFPQCGAAGQPPCGPAACAIATPTPTPVTGCTGAPTTSPPQDQPMTVQATGFCDPTATGCTAPCSSPAFPTCTDHSGRTCPATSCVSVWGCQGGTQWYNSGTYYPTCPNSCNASICREGDTQTLCGTACQR